MNLVAPRLVRLEGEPLSVRDGVILFSGRADSPIFRISAAGGKPAIPIFLQVRPGQADARKPSSESAQQCVGIARNGFLPKAKFPLRADLPYKSIRDLFVLFVPFVPFAAIPLRGRTGTQALIRYPGARVDLGDT